MEQPCEREREREVLPEERGRERRAAAHEERCDEVNDERISEPRAGKFWMLRREVVAVREARDDAEMKRQVAQVVLHAGEQLIVLHEECTIKDEPEEHGGNDEQHERPSRLPCGPRQSAAQPA